MAAGWAVRDVLLSEVLLHHTPVHETGLCQCQAVIALTMWACRGRPSCALRGTTTTSTRWPSWTRAPTSSRPGRTTPSSRSAARPPPTSGTLMQGPSAAHTTTTAMRRAALTHPDPPSHAPSQLPSSTRLACAASRLLTRLGRAVPSRPHRNPTKPYGVSPQPVSGRAAPSHPHENPT